jgi:hypothetical protein
MTVITPVWVWLPGRDEPTRAGELVNGNGARFIYRPDYARADGTLALDPVELRITRSSRGTAILGVDGLPGVVRDAKPAGYGEDRLKACQLLLGHSARSGQPLHGTQAIGETSASAGRGHGAFGPENGLGSPDSLRQSVRNQLAKAISEINRVFSAALSKRLQPSAAH